jgi:aspartate aminotransferase-like enzyme
MSPLFIPGPVDVADEVALAQTKPMLPHRSPAFEEIFHRAEGNMRKVFRTQHRVFITASSGSGLHEAAVRNLANSRVLSCVNGAFGKRWYDVAISNGKQADLLETDWQQPITPEVVAEALDGKNYEIITIIHNETSTGMENPVKEVAEAVHKVSPDTLICVDAVSSLSGARLEMDDWGLDLVLTSSQKALALPPGLAFAAVNDRAMEKVSSVKNRGWYFDFALLEKHRTTNSTPATPAISLIYALDLQLERIISEGIEPRWERHSGMAAHTQAWALKTGMDMFAPEGYRSKTVTTIENTRGIDIKALNAFLSQRNMRIASGYGKIKERTFRIGHMGELTKADLDALFAAIEEFLGS